MEFLHHTGPFNDVRGLLLACSASDGDEPVSEQRDSFRQGEVLLHELARSFAEPGAAFTVKKRQNGQPYGKYRGRELAVSITHNETYCLAGIMPEGGLGIDVESTGRPVHPRLSSRIHCGQDSNCEDLDPIRLWTLKEAALKWLGTGLRTPMNRIAIQRLTDDRFSIQTPDRRGTALSLEYNRHWIAVVFDVTEPNPQHYFSAT